MTPGKTESLKNAMISCCHKSEISYGKRNGSICGLSTNDVWYGMSKKNLDLSNHF